MPLDVQKYRSDELRNLTNEWGVYALCDLDNVKIYVGQSVDGIRTRVRRHLTSARSDVIANRLLDVWEVAYVSAWPMPNSTKDEITNLESYLFHQYNSQVPLMNGSVPTEPTSAPDIPDEQVIQVLPDPEIEIRRTPSLRLPRQISQFQSLFDYILEVKNNEQQRRALVAHFDRLNRYYENFVLQHK